MDRRRVLRNAVAVIPALSIGWPGVPAAQPAAPGGLERRVRPSDPAWPSQDDWSALDRAVGGRLIRVESPLDLCGATPSRPECANLPARLGNPYYLGDEVGLTQSLGWVGAWTSTPSVYAVAAESTGDVVAAVDFSRRHRVRLAVKGGGHSHKGTSCAPDSLLIWTRNMHGVVLHDGFVPSGCAGRFAPQPAATIEAGAMWGQAYHAVTTTGGRYVQGGGCLTVGVAGLIQSGGFGSFSKAYGTASASLLEAEIVTADGTVRTVNACTEPDLFWAIKGGGGGSFGVVTRLTVRTHELPSFFGGVNATIRARSDDAYRRLIGETLRFYAEHLASPHWGEQITFRRDAMTVAMVFQGLSQAEAEAVWRPFFAEIAAAPADFAFEGPRTVLAAPAQRLWDARFLRGIPGIVLSDNRPGAPETNIFWVGNRQNAGEMHYAYQSAWLPQSLLTEARRSELADTLFAATRHWGVSLHFNKGLAGAPEAAREATADTAINPLALDAFALAICGASGPPAHPKLPGRTPDTVIARDRAEAVGRAMGTLKQIIPAVGSYWSESNFFEEGWQQSFWGENYARLRTVKERYDPAGLFTVHHGVGSERWSADGFEPAR